MDPIKSNPMDGIDPIKSSIGLVRIRCQLLTGSDDKVQHPLDIQIRSTYIHWNLTNEHTIQAIKPNRIKPKADSFSSFSLENFGTK